MPLREEGDAAARQGVIGERRTPGPGLGPRGRTGERSIARHWAVKRCGHTIENLDEGSEPGIHKRIVRPRLVGEDEVPNSPHRRAQENTSDKELPTTNAS